MSIILLIFSVLFAAILGSVVAFVSKAVLAAFAVFLPLEPISKKLFDDEKTGTIRFILTPTSQETLSIVPYSNVNAVHFNSHDAWFKSYIEKLARLATKIRVGPIFKFPATTNQGSNQAMMNNGPSHMPRMDTTVIYVIKSASTLSTTSSIFAGVEVIFKPCQSDADPNSFDTAVLDTLNKWLAVIPIIQANILLEQNGKASGPCIVAKAVLEFPRPTFSHWRTTTPTHTNYEIPTTVATVNRDATTSFSLNESTRIFAQARCIRQNATNVLALGDVQPGAPLAGYGASNTLALVSAPSNFVAKNAAVLKIQETFKRFKKQRRMLIVAATKIQNIFRTVLKRVAAKNAAAATIQTQIRSFITKNAAALKIQETFKRFKTQRCMLAVAATKIQNIFRTVQKRFAAKNAAAETIQRLFRNYVAKNAAALKIQATFKRFKKQRRKFIVAATKIQNMFRNVLKRIAAKNAAAAVTIQSVVPTVADGNASPTPINDLLGLLSSTKDGDTHKPVKKRKSRRKDTRVNPQKLNMLASEETLKATNRRHTEERRKNERRARQHSQRKVLTTESYSPSAAPSAAPSTMPSAAPSSVPSTMPPAEPSDVPSLTPSTVPSAAPSAAPSEAPSDVPSTAPSAEPSDGPTLTPSTPPSTTPSAPLMTPSTALSVSNSSSNQEQESHPGNSSSNVSDSSNPFAPHLLVRKKVPVQIRRRSSLKSAENMKTAFDTRKLDSREELRRKKKAERMRNIRGIGAKPMDVDPMEVTSVEPMDIDPMKYTSVDSMDIDPMEDPMEIENW